MVGTRSVISRTQELNEIQNLHPCFRSHSCSYSSTPCAESTLEKRTRTATVCDGQLYMQGRIKDSNINRKEQITNFKFKLG